jgi:hypothetical protein
MGTTVRNIVDLRRWRLYNGLIVHALLSTGREEGTLVLARR